MTVIEQRYHEYLQSLASEFSYEHLGKCLLFLSIPSEFKHPPTIEISRKAKLLRSYLLNKDGVDSRHQGTLIHIQSKLLFEQYSAELKTHL